MAGDYEYIVVGSGAGGGTVAARLAENGKRVLVLESGGDPIAMQGNEADQGGASTPASDYEVPGFHAKSTENKGMRWDYFVRHYSDEARQKNNPNHVSEHEGKAVEGILYPRAGCLGGCTAHNAMIMVYPHNSDWNHIAEVTGDRSWHANNMRRYFQKLENCRYRPISRWLDKIGFNRTKNGFDGWLSTEVALPLGELSHDKKLIKTIAESADNSFSRVGETLKRLWWGIRGLGDPNDWRLVKEKAYGLRYTPLTTHKHRRVGSRERLIAVAEKYPENLHIELNATVTRVLFDENNRATGVEYLKGERLYQAHCQPRNTQGELVRALASKEVILSAGAFNTPQILMLSGIGAREQLEKFGIEVRVELPGVGKNLQDRYEVGVVNRMAFRCWDVLEGADFTAEDKHYRAWREKGEGVYTTNGAILAVIKRSMKKHPNPDLFCFALLTLFRGYFPGYAKLACESKNYLTWAVLKAHTNNSLGEVTLKSANPLDTPHINFHYFDEGNDHSGEDLKSVVEGVKFVRELTQELKQEGLIAEEELPGDAVQSDEEIAEFIKNSAWGHHASCTCPIGNDENPGAVLGSDFKVKGTPNLRVVDASAFPKIPGFFIASAIYMIGEKAADVILQDA